MYIRSVDLDKLLILIVSEETACDLIQRAHSYPQIKAIFIVPRTKFKNELLAKWSDYVRIVPINELATRMNSFKSRWLRNEFERFHFDLFNTTESIGRTSSDLNGEFLTSQYLIHVIISLTPSVKDKDEFVNQCTNALKKYNPGLLKDVQEFRNDYTPSDALTYYTKPTFFFKELNMALRTRNVECLFLFRFFIRDIFDQLTQKQCQHSVRVYRGQRMQKEERHLLEQSIGQLISMNSFFSTSLNRKVALQYLGDTNIQPKKMNKTEMYEEYVLFEIYANPECRSRPFAIIEKNSAVSEEQEVLFGAGAIFHLKSVHCEDQGDGHHPIWIFQIELANGEEHELKYHFNHFHYNYANEELIKLSFSSFGLLLCNMEKYKFGSQLFRRILRNVSSNNLVEQARCQKIMGHITSAQHHYWQSLRWYKRSLTTYAIIDSNAYSTEVASVYDGIGHVYLVRKQYKRAHRSYQKSLTIWKTYYDEDQDQIEIGFCYINEARVYLAEQRLERASELFRSSLCILYKCYSNTPIQATLAAAHCILGEILEELKMFDLAIDHYMESLIIGLKTLCQDDSSVFSVYSKLQIVCEKAERNFDQLLAYNKIPVIQDQTHIDYYNKKNGTRFQMLFKCSRCKRWQWIFTVFRPVKRLVCTGCWRKRCPRLMSYFWVLT
ncbi:unnamed protein product [Rotaria sp. Silwood2]|nr:unnamed protein product [Rotaria sp. Silwood2]